MLSGLVEYIFAFLDRWLFWVGIVFLILDLLKKVPRFKTWAENLPRKILLGVAALCIFISSFQVWHEEHEKLSREVTYIELGEGAAVALPGGLFQSNKAAQIMINKRNSGTYMAKSAVTDGVIEVHDAALDENGMPSTSHQVEEQMWSAFERDKHKDIGLSDISPGQGGMFRFMARRILSEDEAQALRTHKKLMYLLGYAKWTDGSGGPHERRFCAYVAGDINPPVLVQCLGYNDFLDKAED